MQIGNLDIQPRKTNVNVTFVVNSKRTKVEAYIDSGNSFFNCMARETYEKIGFTINQLEESPTPTIRQTEGWVTLQILGKIPNIIKNGFSFCLPATSFLCKIYSWLKDFTMNSTPPTPFLKANDCIIDIENDFLIFESKNFHKEKFSIVLPSSTKRVKKVFFGAQLPTLTPRGRTMFEMALKCSESNFGWQPFFSSSWQTFYSKTLQFYYVKLTSHNF